MTNNAYSSKLKGWAVDRVTELYKHSPKNDKNGEPIPYTIDQLLADADKLVAYTHNPQEEIDTIREELAELEHAMASYEAAAMKPASNANKVN